MIYLFYGPDDYSIHEAVQRLVRAALPAETAELNLTRLTGGEVTAEALRFACEAVPFLAERRAVVVEHLFARLSARRSRGAPKEGPPDGKNGGTEREPRLVGEIAAYLPQVPQRTLLIFHEPDAPPKSGSLAKALADARVKQQFFPLLAGRPLQRWIKDRAKGDGATMTDQAAELLATFVGADLRALSHEVKKLATYAGPGRTVDVPEVRLLVSQAGEANVFEFVDAIGQGSLKQAQESLHGLLEQGERPERILGMVARQVRLLLQASDLLAHGQGTEAIGRALGLPPFPLRKVLAQARLFRLPQLEAMHRRVLAADLEIKTGRQEPALALELLVADLARPLPSATR